MAAGLSVTGASTKVCQATGQTDWYTGATTDAQTMTRNGLYGIDLGFPVESSTGELLFLFGDAVPPNHPAGSYYTDPPDDGLAHTSRTAAPDNTTCLDLKFYGTGRRGSLAHPTVTPPIQQGSFNVPTGGIEVNGKIYAFFWTNHCILSDPYGPNSTTPLVLPPAIALPIPCDETAHRNSIGRGVLAWADPATPLNYTLVATPGSRARGLMPNGFVYATAAGPLPRRRGVDYVKGYQPPIAVFGVARYRQSIPYMALAPQKTFGDVKTWQFYAGTNTSGPIWVDYPTWQSGHVGGDWSPPLGAEVYANGFNAWSGPLHDEQCVGEHQVTWNAALETWLMLYTCGGWQVEARTAPEPWGPWSKPTMLLSSVTDPSLKCKLFWTTYPDDCPGRVDQQPLSLLLRFGYFYAPFVMNRYTENLTVPGPGHPRKAKIYWLLSTWDPYQAVVMQTTLEMN
jgi:hypothetical protein